MIKVIFDPIKGRAYPDGMAEHIVHSWIELYKNGDASFDTSSHLIVDWFRLAIKKKQIEFANASLYYVRPDSIQIEIPILPNGQIHYWPPGFCDHMEDVLDKLLD